MQDDDVEVSQHLFALRLTKSDFLKVLNALQNASVVRDPANPQIVKNGGPADVQPLVKALGVKSQSAAALHEECLAAGGDLVGGARDLDVPGR